MDWATVHTTIPNVQIDQKDGKRTVIVEPEGAVFADLSIDPAGIVDRVDFQGPRFRISGIEAVLHFGPPECIYSFSGTGVMLYYPKLSLYAYDSFSARTQFQSLSFANYTGQCGGYLLSGRARRWRGLTEFTW
jgi:hypothetical protein